MEDDEFDFEDDEEEFVYYNDAKLAWRNYCSYSEIVSDGHSTVFLDVGNDELTEKEFVNITKWAKTRFPESKRIKDEYENESLRITHQTEFVNVFPLHNCLVLRSAESKIKSEVIKYLKDKYENESEFFVELNHKNEKLFLKKLGLIAHARTGILKGNPDWLPYTFMRFYRDKIMVAKALIGYHALEMCETAPTVLMFEVLPKFRRKKISTKIMTALECYFWNYGFPKLRLENTKAIPFWRNLDYDIDIDEGEKYLDYLDFEEDCDQIISLVK